MNPTTKSCERHPDGPVDVLLASMPFAFLDMPSLALGLFKALLAERGIATEVKYFALDFAAELGDEAYQAIAGQPGISFLAGEWVFREAAYPASEDNTAEYFQAILGGEQLPRGRAAPTEMKIQVARARSLAGSFVDRAARFVVERRPKILGLSSVFQQHVSSLALARLVKEREPEILLVMGGANCDDVGGLETLRRHSFLDVVIIGEADDVFPALVEHYLTTGEIIEAPGVHTAASSIFTAAPVVRARGPANLDSLPYPNFDDFFAQTSLFPSSPVLSRRLPFESSRGCWWGEKHHCTFCGLNDSSMTFRFKTPARSVAEVAHLTHRYGPEKLIAADNIIQHKGLSSLLQLLRDERLPVEFYYEVKANLTYSQLVAMREAGITEIQPGIESLDSRILRLMRKGTSKLKNVQLLRWCEELGILLDWNLLWGLPGEPATVYSDLARLLPMLCHLRPPGWMGPISFPRFSPYQFSPTEFGITEIRPECMYDYIYPFDKESIKNLAYYFDAEFAGKEKIPAYTRAAHEATVEWRKSYHTCALFRVTIDDEPYAVDFRPAADTHLRALSRADDAILFKSSSIAGTHALIAEVSVNCDVRESDVVDSICQLAGHGYLLQEDSQILSLIINLDDYECDEAVAEKFLRSEKASMVRRFLSRVVERHLVPLSQ